MGTLLTSAGKLLVRAGRFVYTTCAACCTNVAYYRANPCPDPVPPNSELCQGLGPPPNDPRDPIYINASLYCGNHKVRPGDVIYVDGACYTVVAPLLQPPLPPGARVIEPGDQYECLPEGCADLRCARIVGSALGVAVPCDPTNPFTASGRRYVFCRVQFPGCAYVKLSDTCFKVGPTCPDAGVLGPLDQLYIRDPSDVLYGSCCDCFQFVNPNNNPGCLKCLTLTFRSCVRGVLSEGGQLDCGCYNQNAENLGCRVAIRGHLEQRSDSANYRILDWDYPNVACISDFYLPVHLVQYENGHRTFDGMTLVEPLASYDGCVVTPNVLVHPGCTPTSTHTETLWADCVTVRIDFQDLAPDGSGTTGWAQATRNVLQNGFPCADSCTGGGPAARARARATALSALRAELDNPQALEAVPLGELL